MTRRTVRAGLVVALIGIATAIGFRPTPRLAEAAGQGAEPKGKPALEAEIRKLNADYAAAMTDGDLASVMAFWAADADYIDEAGKHTQGRDEIAALFQKAAPETRGWKTAIKVQSLKFLRPEICLEDGVVERTAPTGVKEANRFAIVWTKADGKWLISNVRDLPVEATDLPSVAAGPLKELEWLVGEWASSGDKAEATVKVTWATNRAFLLMEYTIKRDQSDPLEVKVRVGWDARQGRIRSWVFDSTGGFAEAYWRRDGKRWVVGTSGVLPDGGTGGATNVYEFIDENTFTWRSTERDVDGQPLPDAEAKFVRKPARK